MNPRVSLLLLAAVCVLPLVASTLLFAYGPRPDATVNHGELILPPVALPAAAAGADAELRQRTSIWQLAALAPAACTDESCRQRLCMIHQARLVNVGKLPRIRLLWLAFGSGQPPDRLPTDPDCGRQLAAGQVEGLKPIDTLADTRIVAIGEDLHRQLGAGAIFIIDPAGRAMMRYRSDAQVADIAKDLGRLLRLSQRN